MTTKAKKGEPAGTEHTDWVLPVRGCPCGKHGLMEGAGLHGCRPHAPTGPSPQYTDDKSVEQTGRSCPELRVHCALDDLSGNRKGKTRKRRASWMNTEEGEER